MFKSSISRFIALGSFVIASSAGVATAGEPTPTRAGQQSTLRRAHDDVLRQLKPSGLKRHGSNIAHIADRGYRDVLVKIKAPSTRNTPAQAPTPKQ
jgi:hypothetical protein